MHELPIQPGDVVAGRYRINRMLGAGPMSVVVSGTHLEIGREVAIKFLNPHALDAQAAERFRREAQRAAKIRNEHVVRVIDVGALEAGLPFMVMDLVEGNSLEDEVAARGPLPLAEAVHYVLQATEGLSEAHGLGIVHRDLKPANLFLARRRDGSRIVKLMDFGVSKSLVESNGDARLGLTRTGMLIGSPLYMAPEQLQAPGAVDTRADIWALGVVLFQLLSAHVPYETRSLPELCSMLLRDRPTPLTKYRSDIPEGLLAVIERCLQRDRAERFSTLAELAEALVPFAPAPARIHAERARRLLDAHTASRAGERRTPVPDGAPEASEPAASPSPGFRVLAVLALVAMAGLGVAIALSHPKGAEVQSAANGDAPGARPENTAPAAVRYERERTPEPVSPASPAEPPPEPRRSPRVEPVRPRNASTVPPATTLASAAASYELPDFGGRK